MSYGYCAAGRYAVEQLRGVFTELHTATLRDAVCLDLLEFTSTAPEPHAVTALLDELLWWGLALRDGRRARPYCA